MTSGYQPSHDIERFNFSEDLAFGQEGEELIRKFYKSLGKGDAEIKRDRFNNGRMVVEIEQNPFNRGWKPSGLMVTTAYWWVYIFCDEGFVSVAVPRLKLFIDVHKRTLKFQDFAEGSENPTRGYLLYPDQISDLMSNKAYEVKE